MFLSMKATSTWLLPLIPKEDLACHNGGLGTRTMPNVGVNWLHFNPSTMEPFSGGIGYRPFRNRTDASSHCVHIPARTVINKS